MRRLYRIQGKYNGSWETWDSTYSAKNAWQLAYEYALASRQRIRLVTTNNEILWERRT